MGAMRINHLFVNSVNVELSTRFYCDLLGFVPTKKFNEGHGDGQIVHRDTHGRDFDLLIVPTGTEKLVHAQHIAFEIDSAVEFETIFETAKKLGLKPRAQVPLASEAGMSDFEMYGKAYRHFYVLDPSWVNIEILFCTKQKEEVPV